MQHAWTYGCLLFCMGVQKMNQWGVLPVNFNHSYSISCPLVCIDNSTQKCYVNANQIMVGLGTKLAESCIPTSWSITESGMEMKQNMKVMNINHICFTHLTLKSKLCGDIFWQYTIINYNLQLLLSESLGSNGGGVWCGLSGHTCRDMALEWSGSVKVRSMTFLKFIYSLLFSVKGLSKMD